MVNQLSAGSVLETWVALLSSCKLIFFFFFLHPVSWCSQQRCRLWFPGHGWKWKAILGPHLQPQHLGDWGTFSVSHHSNSRTWSVCLSVIIFLCWSFSDCNQLQDIHRQLEYSNRNLAQNVCAANVDDNTVQFLSFHEPFFLKHLIPAMSSRVCYDRAPKHRLALTFILSALWHGVYPGYYFTFITAIPITMAARAVSTQFKLILQCTTARKMEQYTNGTVNYYYFFFFFL